MKKGVNSLGSRPGRGEYTFGTETSVINAYMDTNPTWAKRRWKKTYKKYERNHHSTKDELAAMNFAFKKLCNLTVEYKRQTFFSS